MADFGSLVPMPKADPRYEGADLPIRKPNDEIAQMLRQQSLAQQQKEASYNAMLQQLKMALARDPSIAWGKDGMNPADRAKSGPNVDMSMPNYGRDPSAELYAPTDSQMPNLPKLGDPATWGNKDISFLGPNI